jgi:hypothetical protein
LLNDEHSTAQILIDSIGMDSFSFQLDRLKQALGVKEDQEVASALGLSRAALSERKRRGSFPVDKLKVLAAQRPDEVNVDFVLGAEPNQALVRAMLDVYLQTQAASRRAEAKGH